MGYIEDIKKINALAKELLQHNIVQSQDEAVVKARDMLVKKESSQGDYIDLSKNSIPQQESERRVEWKDAMAKNNEFIINELKKFKSDVESFAGQLQMLRNELAELKTTNGVNIRKEELHKEEPQVQNSVGQDAVEKKEYVNHPRSGNYKPNDVAIEKFFYYGNKR